MKRYFRASSLEWMSRVVLCICVELTEVNRLSMRISSPAYGDAWSFRPQNQNCILGDRYVNVDNANASSAAPMLLRYSYKFGSYYDSCETTLTFSPSLSMLVVLYLLNMLTYTSSVLFCNFVDFLSHVLCNREDTSFVWSVPAHVFNRIILQLCQIIQIIISKSSGAT